MKVIIPKINSVWGVFKNLDKSKTYRHILSFDNEIEKINFIGEYLFNKLHFDYREAIDDEAFSNNTFKKINSNEAQIHININQLNKNPLDLHFTHYDILNSNFLISMQKTSEGPEYKFWSIAKVKSLGDGVNYLASLELDVFFTYDIKDMIDDKPLIVDNAHCDRFKMINVEGKIKYVPNFDLKSPNTTNEKFDESIGMGSLIPMAHETLKYDYSHLYMPNLSEEEKNVLDVAFNNMQSVLVTAVEPLGNDPFGLAKDNKYQKMTLNSHPTAYYVYDFPFFKDYKDENDLGIEKHFNIKVEAANKTFYIAGIDDFYEKFGSEKSRIIPMATTITSTNSFNNMIGYKDNKKINFRIKCEIDKNIDPKTNKRNVTIIFVSENNIMQNINDGKFNFVEIKDAKNTSKNLMLNPYEIKVFGYDETEDKPNSIVAKWNVWMGDLDNFVPEVGQVKNLSFETKSYLSKYSKMQILTMSNNVYEFKREYLIPFNKKNFNSTITIRKANTFQPELEREIFGVNGNYEQHDPNIDPYN